MNAQDTDRLTSVFRTLFNEPGLELRDTLTARDVDGWDSLNHVNLMILIEEEFGVRFTTGEVSALQDVGELKRLLSGKLAARRAA
ncbi:MAG TPA: acyl carrier protein [Gemmataceae bacterium]|jgi:acyl carrier protein|nr:acyl carrier protein [Gemmataceae bacterium]